MNLMTFLNAGARLAPSEADRQRAKTERTAEALRDQWLDALVLDQTQAWMHLGERQAEVLQGLVTMLTLAAYCDACQQGHDDSPASRVMRGAISAAERAAADRDCVLSADDVQAFHSAVEHAQAVVRSAGVDALVGAAQALRRKVGLPC